MMRVVPVSCWRKSWVLRAMRAEKSVGSASASSNALVCRDCVCPWVAAMASIAVRTTLLNTSCAVSDQPEVWQWVRSEEHTSELQSRQYLVCRLLLEKKKKITIIETAHSQPTTPKHSADYT